MRLRRFLISEPMRGARVAASGPTWRDGADRLGYREPVPGDRVRCPRCREAAADDAAWCSRCGAALAGEVLVIEPPNARDAPPVGHPGGSAPSGPRHRRRRRVDRRTVAGGVALAVVAVVVAVVGPWQKGGGGTAAGPTSTTARSRGAATSRPSTTTTAIPPVFLTERTGGVRLVLARGGAVDVVDLDANTVARHEVADLSLIHI